MRVDLKAVGITGSNVEQATVMFLIDFRKTQESLIIFLEMHRPTKTRKANVCFCHSYYYNLL